MRKVTDRCVKCGPNNVFKMASGIKLSLACSENVMHAFLLWLCEKMLLNVCDELNSFYAESVAIFIPNVLVSF